MFWALLSSSRVLPRKRLQIYGRGPRFPGRTGNRKVCMMVAIVSMIEGSGASVT